jgi:hypothetical protein
VVALRALKRHLSHKPAASSLIAEVCDRLETGQLALLSFARALGAPNTVFEAGGFGTAAKNAGVRCEHLVERAPASRLLADHENSAQPSFAFFPLSLRVSARPSALDAFDLSVGST